MKTSILSLLLSVMFGAAQALEVDIHTNGRLPYITEHPCQGEPNDSHGCHLRVNPQTGSYAGLNEEEATTQAIKLCKELALPSSKYLTVHFQRDGSLKYTCRVNFDQVDLWWRGHFPRKPLVIVN